MNSLKIIDLHAKINGKEILKGIDLEIKSGEIHAIMGPNGSGKSTLCYVLMNHPRYTKTKGKILLNGKDLSHMDTSERAKNGLFLGFQSPLEIPGVGFESFLRTAKNAISEKKLDPFSFHKTLQEKLKALKMKENFGERNLNEGFSGGEKKRAEIAQMAILEPKFALLDEIDSGLDIDALKTVASAIKEIYKKNKLGILLITHYQRLLNYITPDHVHVISDGKIVKSGTKKLALELEKTGYEKYLKN